MASAADTRGVDGGAVAVAITGVVVSGVLGPSVATWLTRGNDERKAIASRAESDREELRQLLDDAAALLSSGPRLIRMAREVGAGNEERHALDLWAAEVFPLEQRLRLRLPATSDVVIAYERVRDDLTVLVGREASNNAPLDAFEQSRDAFLEAGRSALGPAMATS